MLAIHFLSFHAVKGCWPLGNTFLPLPWYPQLSFGHPYRLLVFLYILNYTWKLENWNNLVHFTPVKQELSLIWSAVEEIPPPVFMGVNRINKRGERFLRLVWRWRRGWLTTSVLLAHQCWDTCRKTIYPYLPKCALFPLALFLLSRPVKFPGIDG